MGFNSGFKGLRNICTDFNDYICLTMHATRDIRLSGTPVFLFRVASVLENASYKTALFLMC